MIDLWGYLTSPFAVRAMVGIVLIAINAGLTGAFAAFRSATFLVSGAAHAALAGAAFVLVVWGATTGDVAPIIGGAVAAVLLALMAAGSASRAGRRGGVDNTIGVGFAFFMALAVLLISMIPSAAARVWSILLGDLLLLTGSDLWLLGGMTALLVAAFGVWWRPFLFITFDTEGAQAFGLRAGLYNHLLFALIGLSTAVLLKGVGAIVVFAMLAAPAATALLFADSVPRTMAYAFLIALLSGLLALVLSNYVQFSVSAMAALLASGSYFLGRGIVWARQAAQNGGGQRSP